MCLIILLLRNNISNCVLTEKTTKWCRTLTLQDHRCTTLVYCTTTRLPLPSLSCFSGLHIVIVIHFKDRLIDQFENNCSKDNQSNCSVFKNVICDSRQTEY